MQFNKEQKDILSKYFVDVSRFTFTALVVGKFIAPNIKDWVFLLGVFFTIVTLAIALIMKKEGD
ncbi:MAG: hypothetical protein HZB80_10425 [Deltaproteobacteria bacterium]|nr:hypothetical protein [Deltaproteobacteria bacterium]